ncbi:hypothetical protein T12_8993, partial [Trichinella patagoniensis]
LMLRASFQSNKRLDGQLTNSTPHLPYLLQAVEIVFNSRRQTDRHNVKVMLRNCHLPMTIAWFASALQATQATRTFAFANNNHNFLDKQFSTTAVTITTTTTTTNFHCIHTLSQSRVPRVTMLLLLYFLQLIHTKHFSFDYGIDGWDVFVETFLQCYYCYIVCA